MLIGNVFWLFRVILRYEDVRCI